MKNKLINYRDWKTIHNSIPFEEMDIDQILPAIKEGIVIQENEIKEIKENAEDPTFQNTILQLESGDKTLSLAVSLMVVFSATKDSEELIAIQKEASDLLVEHSLSIEMDRDLFKRVKSVYDKKDSLNLTEEEKTVLENRYRGFIRSGIHLEKEEKEEFENISKEISKLTISFDENMKKESEEFFMKVNLEDLSGLSKETINFCKEKAKEKNIEGYGIVFDRTFILMELLKFLKSRYLRKKLWEAVSSQCANNNSTDNKENIRKIVNLKLKLSKILGFDTYADFALEERMAKTKDIANNFLNDLKSKSKPAALRDVKNVSDYAKKIEGEDFILMPWDFSYYSEKLREEKYLFNEEEVMRYFSLDNVKIATFSLIQKMYGVTFRKNKEVQAWNNDVEVYEAYSGQEEGEGFLGLIYLDLFMRPGTKKSGAWMFDFVTQNNTLKEERPHIQLCMNLKKPENDSNPLMIIRDVETFLHEFGHVLHGLFSKVKYESVAGTNVYRDFVELPSQIMENFLYERDLFLNSAAKHIETKEGLPEDLYKKLLEAKRFNKGYQCIRQLSFGVQDMAYYSLEEPLEKDIIDFEEETQRDIKVLPDVLDFNGLISTSFSHIFSGGYSAGYYSYKWAEVLDADAFEFMKNNDFSKEIMDSFKKNILEKGGSVSPDILYRRFRGSMPTSEAMLRRDGLI